MTTHPTITIRGASSADIPRLLDLERRSSTSAHWPETLYQEFLSGDLARLVLVSEMVGNDHMVGFLVAHQIAGEWELENIVVEEAEQRKGIGTGLLTGLISKGRATNSEAVFLEVRASNLAARALYEAAGFRQSGLRKSYYANPLEDAVLYRLDLD